MTTTKSKPDESKTRWIVVTTDNTRRGVFCGILLSWDSAKCICKLQRARMAVYWSSTTKGVLGLAAIGPQAGSKISSEIPAIELNGVTAIMDMTPIAIKQWQEDLWG